MITARKGDNIIKVSKHSFETMFKDKGYVVVSDEVREKVETVIAEPIVKKKLLKLKQKKLQFQK